MMAAGPAAQQTALLVLVLLPLSKLRNIHKQDTLSMNEAELADDSSWSLTSRSFSRTVSSETEKLSQFRFASYLYSHIVSLRV
jgi:hypothetical protein